MKIGSDIVNFFVFYKLEGDKGGVDAIEWAFHYIE